MTRPRTFAVSVAVALCVALPTPASAGDWIESLSRNTMYGIGGAIAATRILLGDELNVATRLDEEIEISDNIALETDPPGGAAVSATSAATGSIGTSHRTRQLEFRATAEKVDVTGPGDPGNLESENRYYFSRYNNTQKRFRYNIRSARTIENAASAQLRDSTIPTLEDTPGDPDTGGTITQLQAENVTSVDEEQETFIVGGDITFQLNARNSLFFTAEAVQQNFTDVVNSGSADTGNTSELVDSETITTALAWTVQTSETTSLTASISNQDFKPGDEGDSRKIETRGILDVQVSPRLNVTLDGGVAFVRGEGETFDDANFANPIGDGSGSSAAFVGAFGLSYSLKRTAVSFGVSREVSPTSTGDLELVEGANVNVAHDINSRSSVSLNARYRKRTSPGDLNLINEGTVNRFLVTGRDSETDFFSVTPTYLFALSRSWAAEIAYEYAREIDDSPGTAGSGNGTDSVAESNTFFFRISRTFPVKR